ncbi:MAG TPA: DNA polymerase Y family protein [Rhodocyclaceae bacterium]
MDPLWLALDLPRLPLEAHPGLPGPDRPFAIVAAGRILACDDAALASGVRAGLGLSAARAMAPQLLAAPHDAARIAATLETLACWAGNFTPRVVLAPPQALLLEIGGCLRYFGGADKLLADCLAGCAAQGFRAHAAIAPTPQGALWLAQAGRAAICRDPGANMNPLWLALDLPRLPLDAHPNPPEPERPFAVSAAGRILACDDAAAAAGVAVGMGLSAARAMAPQLLLAPHDPAREAAALDALACWAGDFTPRVVQSPPQALLLEIGGCLRYFGGPDRLRDAVVAGGASLGFHGQAAIAPTPQGALWLAQAGSAAACLDVAALTAALDALPLDPLPHRARERLAAFGARRLGDVRRLPRSGVAQRIGAEALAGLARAYGELPDPRRDFAFPERFEQSLEFVAPVADAGALLFAARRFTAALAGWLAARQAGITACRLRLAHRGRGPTLVELRFAAATRDAGRFERVLRERLERLALAAPVEGLALVADAIADLPGRSDPLFGRSRAGGENFAALVERLRARLGDAAVHGLAIAADHRPEAATREVAQGEDAAAAAAAPRPIWLLPAPEPIAERGGRPWRNGPLRLVAGPERIEAGWWDEGEGRGDARRDYFVALTADARWAWIFRELAAPGGWFLHGWFG